MKYVRVLFEYIYISKYLESSQEVSTEGLYTLSQHKYKSGSYTPLDLLFYKIWWTPVSHLVPEWMAPNLVSSNPSFIL